ncbi:MAG: hypothetical protein ACRDQB_04535 [Thermocrispum sp.]
MRYTDVDWLADTTAVLGGADTYLLVTRMYGWSLDEYQSWLDTTLRGPGGACSEPSAT